MKLDSYHDSDLRDLTVTSSQYDIRFCSETLVSDMRHVSELLVPGFGRPSSRVVSGQDTSGPWDVGVRTRWLRSISPAQISMWLLRNAVF